MARSIGNVILMTVLIVPTENLGYKVCSVFSSSSVHNHIYRPQTKFAKVIGYVFTGVCLSTGGCAWLLRGGGCMVAPRGGMCGCSRGGGVHGEGGPGEGGHAW